MNVAHHYDISDDLYFLFLDPLSNIHAPILKVIKRVWGRLKKKMK